MFFSSMDRVNLSHDGYGLVNFLPSRMMSKAEYTAWTEAACKPEYKGVFPKKGGLQFSSAELAEKFLKEIQEVFSKKVSE